MACLLPTLLHCAERNLIASSKSVLEFVPTKSNSRNSEGSFLKLKDGCIIYIYTRYNTSTNHDNAPADLAARYSYDGGETWTKNDVIILKNEGSGNVMSVSLLRLQNGDIAMLYLKKSQIAKNRFDCVPMYCVSKDECKSWSEPKSCIGEKSLGYYVVNNDRLVQLKNGRLIFPAAYHRTHKSSRGLVYVYYSDDNGLTWRESPCNVTTAEKNTKSSLQEPGIVELSDGRLMLWARTDMGNQFKSYSCDGGVTWDIVAKRAEEFASPEAPLSIKRNPADNSLMAVWCDHSKRWNFPKPEKYTWGRTPYVIAFSHDDGNTWENHVTIETDSKSGYCYSAILFEGNSVLLAYCCGGNGIVPLLASRIRKIDFKN